MYVVKVSLILLYLFPLTSLADEILGEKLFNRSCATCHKRTAPNIIGTKLMLTFDQKTFVHFINIFFINITKLYSKPYSLIAILKKIKIY